MRDHLSSSHRPEQASMLAALKSNNNLAYIVTACLLVLLATPVAFGWQRVTQPIPARNATSTTTSEPVAEQTSGEELAEPAQPSEGASSQVEASTVVNNNQASTQLKVNGKEITVPQNGTVNQTVPNAAGGVTSVNVSSSSDSSGTNSTQLFTSIQTNSTNNQSSTIINNSP